MYIFIYENNICCEQNEEDTCVETCTYLYMFTCVYEHVRLVQCGGQIKCEQCDTMWPPHMPRGHYYRHCS